MADQDKNQRIPESLQPQEPPEDASVSIDDIDTLKTFADTRAIEIASGDIVAHIRNDANALEEVGAKPGTYYRDLIYALIQIRLPEKEAENDWREILRHKYLISEKLGRNVGIHVATLDYYTNIKRRLRNPKILDVREYLSTASRAIIDDLTGAYNRRFFTEELKRLFHLAKTENQPFSLIMLDLDHFKIYNDINGHIRGDIALIEVVRILHAVCSANEVVSRYGGEEFVIMLPEKTLESALGTAEHVRRAIYDYRFVNEQELPGGRLSVSLGITCYRDDMKRETEMVEEADVALYRAKTAGRNRLKAFLRGE
jgi:diguanylate cyclase (GGDEF)-like protein